MPRARASLKLVNDLPELPPVSVIMPVLNEAQHLADAARAVLGNGYNGELELVMALGPSVDDTHAVAESLAHDERVVLVDNPGGSTPAALNAAIGASHHDVVVRADAHAQLPAGYIALAVDALRRTGAGNVGGRMVPTASAAFAAAVAIAMSSRWGIGGAGHRVGGVEGPADSVYLGAFRREALAAVGGYDEHFARAQDWELNHRLRTAGYGVHFVPTMAVPYTPRSTWRALARQFYESGRWRREVVRTYPDTRSVRYLAAPVVTGALVVSVVAGVLGVLTGLAWLAALFVVPVAYLVGVLIASATHLGDGPLGVVARLPLVLPTMHVAWGMGYLRGIR